MRTFAVSVLLVVVCLAGCSGDEGKPTNGTNGSTQQGGTSSGLKKNGDVGCTEQGTECESGVCFIGNTQAFCTVKCTPETASAVCLAPLTGGCNNKGYCKRD